MHSMVNICIHSQFVKFVFILHCVPKKTCDYIFCNNFNSKCPITIIFGIVISKSMRHRKMVSLPTSPIGIDVSRFLLSTGA